MCEQGGGVVSLCCSRGIWHGAERERGRKRHSLLGINSSSEVWTEILTMGRHDWKHNGKSQAPCLFLFPSSLHRPRRADSSTDLAATTIGSITADRCTCLYSSTCLDASNFSFRTKISNIRSEANTTRGHKFHRCFETRRLGVKHVVNKDMGWNLSQRAMWIIYTRKVPVMSISWAYVFWWEKQMAR